MLKSLTAAAAFFALSMLPALAEDIKVGNLKLETPWARATPKGAEVGSAYLTIHNDGAEADTLVSAAADVAAVQIHEMSMTGGVMKMRELANGLAIPPHATVKLGPGSFHLMLVNLKQALKSGETLAMKLKFAKAGEVTVSFPIQPVGSSGPAGGDGMNGMKM